MSYYTYILRSIIKRKFYIGSCSDLNQRIKQHNAGESKFTRPYIPWEIVYKKEFGSRSEAYKYELSLKKIRNNKLIEKLIENKG